MAVDVTSDLYEAYHANCGFDKFGEHTFQGDRAMGVYPDAQSVLDFGCGNGYAVRRMRAAGWAWDGVEISHAAYEQHLDAPYFHLGDLSSFADRQFDMVYSTEVLEHIPEPEVERVAADICRVAARYIFLTISLRPSSDNNRYHCTLKPRAWWEAKFKACGFVVDQAAIDHYQRRTLKRSSEILQQWAWLGPIPTAFAQNPPYNLHGEEEFWYFAFHRRGVALPRRTRPRPSWRRRRLYPLLHRLLRIG